MTMYDQAASVHTYMNALAVNDINIVEVLTGIGSSSNLEKDSPKSQFCMILI